MRGRSSELARGRRDAVVVISDKTRPVPNGIVLPPILRTLEAAGIARERIEILVATGLHRANTPDELIEMTSAAIVERYRIRNHVARNPDEHVHLGRTRRGTEIWLDRGFLAADLKIVTGLIEPHLMAGYSGGRKAVAPGLAGVETMRSAHGPTMLEDNIGPGIIDGNPFHEDLLEIVARRMWISGRRVHRPRPPAHRACLPATSSAPTSRHGDSSSARCGSILDAPADIVITSAGGYPLDDTFYQAIKGLTGALNIVRRGGTIILAAALSEGIGSQDFQELLRSARSNDELHGAHHQPRLLPHRPVDGAAPLPGAAQGRGDAGHRWVPPDIVAACWSPPRPQWRRRSAAHCRATARRTRRGVATRARTRWPPSAAASWRWAVRGWTTPRKAGECPRSAEQVIRQKPCETHKCSADSPPLTWAAFGLCGFA